MTVRVVIVDDEELARRGVRARLDRLGDVEILAECGSGREAVDAIRRTAPDLVFLDVQMPGKSGFDVVEEVGWSAFPRVIFVTAHDRFAVRAFEINALDYLLKPIDDERFDRALQRAREDIERDRESELGRRLASVVREVGGRAAETDLGFPDRFVVRSFGRVVFVPADDIDWIEAAGDYVTLHVGAKAWLLRETMTAIERKLNPRAFVRIHRSTIVNIDRIAELRSFDNGEYQVLLADGTKLKLSRTYRQTLQRFVDGQL